MSMDLDQLAEQAVSESPISVPAIGAVRARAERRKSHRSAVAVAAAASVLVFVVSAMVLANPRHAKGQAVAAGSGLVTADGSITSDGSVSQSGWGSFIWPAPPRSFASVSELVAGFAADELGWNPEEVRRDGGVDGQDEPQSFTMVNLALGHEVSAIAIPSADGWGFVQLGGGPIAVGSDTSLRFSVPSGAVSSNVEVRFLDGTVRREVVDGNSLMLDSDRDLFSVVSAFVVHRDADGIAVGVSGGQFGTGDSSPATTVLADPASVVESDLEPEPSSQNAAAAGSDGVIDAVAALPLSTRLDVVEHPTEVTRIEAPEGTWVISQLKADRVDGVENGCLIGDASGVFGLDSICVHEYSEILLLDAQSGEIVRAYPFAQAGPTSLLITDDALYCIRQGDGGVPDSTLCRISRSTFDHSVRVFPRSDGTAFPADQYLPDDWTINDPIDLVLWQTLTYQDGTLSITGDNGSAEVDPLTLALIKIQVDE